MNKDFKKNIFFKYQELERDYSTLRRVTNDEINDLKRQLEYYERHDFKNKINKNMSIEQLNSKITNMYEDEIEYRNTIIKQLLDVIKGVKHE